MTELLEYAELLQRDGVAEMEIRRGGVHAELHAQRAARFDGDHETSAKVLLSHEGVRARPDLVELPRDFRIQPLHRSVRLLIPRSVSSASTDRSCGSCGTASTIWNS